MDINLSSWNVSGLGLAERAVLDDLLSIYRRHISGNEKKDRYYEGKISLNSVNLGIALPDGLSRLEIGCAWGAKTVDVLAGRSMFDGFVGVNGEAVKELETIVSGNRLIAEYGKACRDELKYGCTFATLSSDPALGCKIRFHSPQTAAARWDGERGRIKYGFAVISTAPDNNTCALYSI